MATNGKAHKGRKDAPLGLIDEDTVASDYLHISTRTLQRERQKRRIEFFRVGLRVYYTQAQIESYLKQHCASVTRTRSVQAAAA